MPFAAGRVSYITLHCKHAVSMKIAVESSESESDQNSDNSLWVCHYEKHLSTSESESESESEIT